MVITDRQLEICKLKDWNVRIDSDGDAELENWSPAGENLVFYIEKDKDFVRGVKELSAYFDADEHAEMWVESRGKRGVPNSIRELIDDADAIDKMLQDLATALAETEEVDDNAE